jgi:hypothetical protein
MSDGRFRVLWDCLLVVITLYVCVVIPMRIGFLVAPTPFYTCIEVK